MSAATNTAVRPDRSIDVSIAGSRTDDETGGAKRRSNRSSFFEFADDLLTILFCGGERHIVPLFQRVEEEPIFGLVGNGLSACVLDSDRTGGLIDLHHLANGLGQSRNSQQ